MATMTETPRVWVGCLACYNSGALVGEWVDAVDAAEFVPCQRTGHEEWWCLDTDNMPVDGEMSPADATRYAEAAAEIDAPMAAVRAYVANVGAQMGGRGPLGGGLRKCLLRLMGQRAGLRPGPGRATRQRARKLLVACVVHRLASRDPRPVLR